MRKAWIITVVALFAAVLAAPSSSATTVPTSGEHSKTLGLDAVAEQLYGSVCYQVRTAAGWGDVKCSNQDVGPTAGCSECELEFIKVNSALGNHGYRVLVQSGWGAFRAQPDKVGCFGCVIRAMELTNLDPCCFVEYRVLTDGGWGEWRAFNQMAGCFTCTVHAIQMREKII
jgi:hypothetical protein